MNDMQTNSNNSERLVSRGLGLILLVAIVDLSIVGLIAFYPILIGLLPRSATANIGFSFLARAWLWTIQYTLLITTVSSALNTIGIVFCLATPREVGAGRFLMLMALSTAGDLACKTVLRFAAGYVMQIHPIVNGLLQFFPAIFMFLFYFAFFKYLLRYANFLACERCKVASVGGLRMLVLAIVVLAISFFGVFLLKSFQSNFGGFIVAFAIPVASFVALIFSVLAFLRGYLATYLLRRELRRLSKP